jgi:hypothetical protein
LSDFAQKVWPEIHALDAQEQVGESSSGVSIEGYLTPKKTVFSVYKKAEK